MKELEKVQPDIEISQDQQQKKELKLLGNQRRIPGHILWEFDVNTKEIRRAEFKKIDVAITSLSYDPKNITEHRKVVVKDNCRYVQALNKKNALKKLLK